MKILNQNITDQNFSIEVTKVSKLPELCELYDDSLLHVVDMGRESKKLKYGTFKQKVYEAVQNTFKTEYIDTHNHSDVDAEGWSFKDMVKYLDTDINAFNPEEHTFVEHVNYDFEILRKYIVKKDKELAKNNDDIIGAINTIDCQFNSQMVITTRDNENNPVSVSDPEDPAVSVWHSTTENDMYCQMQIQVGNKISNEWTVPKSGSLVICGWLDSEKVLNNKAIPQAYCVIEGKINEYWEVIGVQPVIPNKSITYVGFTLPVREGLVIRARTGFDVGAKSGGFSNDQDGVGSLSNSVPNGFKCQVYSNKNIPNGWGGFGDGDTHLVVDEMNFDEMNVDRMNLGGIPVNEYIEETARGVIGR